MSSHDTAETAYRARIHPLFGAAGALFLAAPGAFVAGAEGQFAPPKALVKLARAAGGVALLLGGGGRFMDGKLKKALIRKKNRRIWERFLQHFSQMEAVNRDGGLAAPEMKRKSKAAGSKRVQSSDADTMMKLQEIRSKTSARRTQAKERWNRFAATGDAGGRGL